MSKAARWSSLLDSAREALAEVGRQRPGDTASIHASGLDFGFGVNDEGRPRVYFQVGGDARRYADIIFSEDIDKLIDAAHWIIATFVGETKEAP